MSEVQEYFVTRRSWYYNKRLLEYSPSREDGISMEMEETTRTKYCNFIRHICRHLKLDMVPTATALMLCHRFYMHQSLSKNDWKTIGATCVFLACKSEDSFRTLDHIIHLGFTHAIQSISDESKQKVFVKEKIKLIVLAERLVLTTIRFETNVNHAYRPLHDVMKSLGITQRHIRSEAWTLVNSWMTTNMVLQYEPQYIAAGSLYFATLIHDFKLPSEPGSVWWQRFDVVHDSLNDCIRQMVKILCVRKPDYVKILVTRVPPKPINNSQPINHSQSVKNPQPVNIQEQLTHVEKDPKKQHKGDTPISVSVSAHCQDKTWNDNGDSAKLEMIVHDTSVPGEEASKEIELAMKRDEMRKGKGTAGENVKMEVAVQDTSSSGEEVFKGREQEMSKGLHKIDVARIREMVRKRKFTRESKPVKLNVSSDDLDNWIKKEIESGIIAGSEPGKKRKEIESRTTEEKRMCTGDKQDACKDKAKTQIPPGKKRWQH